MNFHTFNYCCCSYNWELFSHFTSFRSINSSICTSPSGSFDSLTMIMMMVLISWMVLVFCRVSLDQDLHWRFNSNNDRNTWYVVADQRPHWYNPCGDVMQPMKIPCPLQPGKCTKCPFPVLQRKYSYIFISSKSYPNCPPLPSDSFKSPPLTYEYHGMNWI